MVPSLNHRGDSSKLILRRQRYSRSTVWPWSNCFCCTFVLGFGFCFRAHILFRFLGSSSIYFFVIIKNLQTLLRNFCSLRVPKRQKNMLLVDYLGYLVDLPKNRIHDIFNVDENCKHSTCSYLNFFIVVFSLSSRK